MVLVSSAEVYCNEVVSAELVPFSEFGRDGLVCSGLLIQYYHDCNRQLQRLFTHKFDVLFVLTWEWPCTKEKSLACIFCARDTKSLKCYNPHLPLYQMIGASPQFVS